MRQYAEAVGCRRRILLSYFSEDVHEDCGNCDICKIRPGVRRNGHRSKVLSLSTAFGKAWAWAT